MGIKRVYFTKLTYDGLQINYNRGFLKIKAGTEIIPYDKVNLTEIESRYELRPEQWMQLIMHWLLKKMILNWIEIPHIIKNLISLQLCMTVKCQDHVMH